MPDGSYAVISRNMSKNSCAQSDMHNGTHTFPKTPLEVLQQPSLRFIPDKYHHDISVLTDTGASIATIHRYLVSKCVQDGIALCFNYDDVKSYVRKSGYMDSAKDISQLLEHLESRRDRNEALKYDTHVDESGRIDGIIFSLDENDLWNSAKDSKVVFLDSKHGTNRYNMKLACFTTIDSNGKTQVLAAAFVTEESKELYTWAMKRFVAFFSAPDVMFTDGDRQIINSITDVCPTTTLLRCVWHVWKNFYQLLKSCFEVDTWKVVSNKFWRIALTSDKYYCDKIEDDWNEMVDYMQSNTSCDQSTVSNLLIDPQCLLHMISFLICCHLILSLD